MSSDEIPESKSKVQGGDTKKTTTNLSSTRSPSPVPSKQQKRQKSGYKNVSIQSILNSHGKPDPIDKDSQPKRINPILPPINSSFIARDNLKQPSESSSTNSSTSNVTRYPRTQHKYLSSIDRKLSNMSFNDHPNTKKSSILFSSLPVYSNQQPPPSTATGLSAPASSTGSISQPPSSLPQQLNYSPINNFTPTNQLYEQTSSSHFQFQAAPTFSAANDSINESKRGRRFRRRYNQIVRKYSCSYPGCTKSYGSLNHLNTHIVTKRHGQRKSKADFQHSDDNNQQIMYHQMPGQSSMSEYSSGSYWYGYPPQDNRVNQQPPQILQQIQQPYQPPPPPPGYMYYTPPSIPQRPISWPHPSYPPPVIPPSSVPLSLTIEQSYPRPQRHAPFTNSLPNMQQRANSEGNITNVPSKPVDSNTTQNTASVGLSIDADENETTKKEKEN